jgi:hypothetical protein
MLHGDFHHDAANNPVFDKGYFESKAPDGTKTRAEIKTEDDFQAKLKDIDDRHQFLIEQTTSGTKQGYAQTSEVIANGELAEQFETLKDGNLSWKANYWPDQRGFMSGTARIDNKDGSSATIKWDREFHLQQLKLNLSDDKSVSVDFDNDGKVLWPSKETEEQAGSTQVREFRQNGTLTHEHSKWSDNSEDDITYDDKGKPALEKQTDQSGHVTTIDYSKKSQ